ncbi:MAG: ACP S-malonyltransferase [Solirubrobacterales bacterium]
MREVVERVRPDLLKLAISEVGEDPFARVKESTRFAQPAIYCASIALWTEAGRPDADFVAGHSLGELAAVVGAGFLSAEDGLRLAVRRGAVMQASGDAEPGGGMLAVIGDDDEALMVAANHSLTVANDNAPGQVVLSGGLDARELAATDAKSRGLRVAQLPVAGAFHSPAMAAAVPEFERALADVELLEPRMVAISGVTAEPFDDVRRRLAEALVAPVRWRDVLMALDSAGVERYIETGPGKVLRGLVKRTLPDADATTLAKLAAAHA